MKRFLISPPIGTWCGAPDAERVLGSFTWEARPGRLKQIARTVRLVPGGWVNNIGLRNPGLRQIKIRQDRIYSLAGIGHGDWQWMAEWLRRNGTKMRVELNLSCPNVAEYGITRRDIEAFTQDDVFVVTIAKMPPSAAAWPLAERCAEAGIGFLHFANTLPSPIGGISGDPLRRINLPLVEEAAKRYPTIPIIGGGGSRNEQHIRQYEDAGARHFSICTGYLSWLASRLMRRHSPIPETA